MSQVPIKAIAKKIIIVKGYSKTIEEVQRTNVHIEHCKAFFLNSFGGAYNQDEIVLINEEALSFAELKSILESIVADFVIIIYIGHGATQDGYQLFQLNEKEIINPGEIKLDIDRQLVIVESCRGVLERNVKVVRLFNRVPDYRKGGKFRRMISREHARCLYDRQIKKCDKGIVICFACDVNEKASNYTFITTLLIIAANWAQEHNGFEVLPITTLMVNVIETLDKEGKQHPQIYFNKDFPFAVSLYQS